MAVSPPLPYLSIAARSDVVVVVVAAVRVSEGEGLGKVVNVQTMIILNGASWERFAAFYNFKDYSAMTVNSIFGGAAFALTIVGVRILSTDFHQHQNHHQQYHMKRTTSYNVTSSELDNIDSMCLSAADSNATTTSNSTRPLATSSLAQEVNPRHRTRFIDVMHSPWILYAVAANCLPFMLFVPDVNKYTISPSICVWLEVVPGPIAFFIGFAFGTQSYTVLWVTQLEGAIPNAPISTTHLIAAYALQFIGIVTAFSSAMVLAVPRCVFEGHQAAVNTSVLCNFAIVALLEYKERTNEGLVCLGMMLAAVYGLIKLDSCKCTLYGVVEVFGTTVQICYLAYRIARLRRFNGAEYAVHVTAITCISWLIMQFTLNFCVNRGVHFQIRGSSQDGMPDRSAMTRITYNPTFFGKDTICFLPGSSCS